MQLSNTAAAVCLVFQIEVEREVNSLLKLISGRPCDWHPIPLLIESVCRLNKSNVKQFIILKLKKKKATPTFTALVELGTVLTRKGKSLVKVESEAA